MLVDPNHDYFNLVFRFYFQLNVNSNWVIPVKEKDGDWQVYFGINLQGKSTYYPFGTNLFSI